MGRPKGSKNNTSNNFETTDYTISTNNVNPLTEEQVTSFEKNLPKYIEFSSWVSWFPDLFLDLITPPEGGIKLHSDQRTFLRCIIRFYSIYGCFPRGWGKTFDEVLAMVIIAIRYPNIDLSLTAQTKENAAELLKDKINEILRYYPILENEIVKTKFHTGDAEILFKNSSRIDVLANAQSSKGQRRKRINIEEAALLDNATFEDALKPIVEVPRYTCGKLALTNPEELNQQINFFTTPGYKGSDEYTRNIDMIKKMVNLDGNIVSGSNWMLGCWYGRGSSKSQILDKKKTMASSFFKMNYGGSWVGSTTNALVNINKLMSCRSLTEAILQPLDKDNDEYYIGVDVARSENAANNQSSIAIGRVKRNTNNNRIISIDLVNLINISNTLNFTAQACIVKKYKKLYNAKMVILDGNGLGSGLIDECLKNSYDPITKENLGCWNTINTDNTPEVSTAERCLFDLKAQSYQSKIITDFIDVIDSNKIRLLEKRQYSEYDYENIEDLELKIVPFIQTDLLIEEVSNLKIKHLSNGSLSIEKVVSKINKDRFSACAYLVWYIMEYTDILKVKEDYSQYIISTGLNNSNSSQSINSYNLNNTKQNQFSNIFNRNKY